MAVTRREEGSGAGHRAFGTEGALTDRKTWRFELQDGGGLTALGPLARSCAWCGRMFIEMSSHVPTITVRLAERSGAGGAADHA